MSSSTDNVTPRIYFKTSGAKAAARTKVTRKVEPLTRSRIANRAGTRVSRTSKPKAKAKSGARKASLLVGFYLFPWPVST